MDYSRFGILIVGLYIRQCKDWLINPKNNEVRSLNVIYVHTNIDSVFFIKKNII